MAEVPISWVSYCADNPPRGRWDQAHLSRIINREEWLVPGGFTFVDTPWTPDDGIGRVIIFPCGHYYDHAERHRVLDAFQHDLAKLKWSLVIATSDEGSTFEWHKIRLPENCKLWVMTPRPEFVYPEGTRFIGEGCPWSSAEVAQHARAEWSKDIELFFSGQINHERRDWMMDALTRFAGESRLRGSFLVDTGGFTLGLTKTQYLEGMCRSRLTPCPSGAMTQDSFRLFEALEAQTLPVVDTFRSDHKGKGYWQMLFDWSPLREIGDWETFGADQFTDYTKQQAVISAWWQSYKRSMAYRLHNDVQQLIWHDLLAGTRSTWGDARDVTVIVPTSPTPSDPDISMIVDTIVSVRRYLPTAEIIVTIDGVRHEQAGGREADYWEYARRLCAWTNTQQNIVPMVFKDHQHQSGMMHFALGAVTTNMVLYVEHDTPLVGEIDFDECVALMYDNSLGLLRFSHEAQILDVHRHLFLETPDGSGFVRTIQWSQRPHLATVDLYRHIMDTYFGINARTMIEDVMHGVVQHEVSTGRIQPEEAWDKWRMAVYAPEGNIKRSEHSDGRAGDPKFGMFIAYDGDVPPGAPQPGWM